MCSWNFYPENFSSYEEYVKYLQEKNFACSVDEQKEYWKRWEERGQQKEGDLSPHYEPKEYTEEELDAILMEAVPKSDLTEEQFNEAKRIWESEKSMLKTVKYLQSVKFGKGIKLAHCYFDLYIDK